MARYTCQVAWIAEGTVFHQAVFRDVEAAGPRLAMKHARELAEQDYHSDPRIDFHLQITAQKSHHQGG
jgi:hypothetical protein